MSEIFENRFGYIKLTMANGGELLVRANKIIALSKRHRGIGTHIHDGTEDSFEVEDSIESIFEQIQDIHPSML